MSGIEMTMPKISVEKDLAPKGLCTLYPPSKIKTCFTGFKPVLFNLTSATCIVLSKKKKKHVQSVKNVNKTTCSPPHMAPTWLQSLPCAPCLRDCTV